jgi:hypothetical protein
MVKRGQLEGRRVVRPQGTAFVITLPADPMDATDDATATRHATGDVERSNATPASQLVAWSETFLVPLVAALERSQATIREQAEELGMTRAERDAARAEVEVLKASQTIQGANPGPEALEPTTDAPAQHQINPGTLVPWLFTALALFGGGRAVAADMSPEALYAGAAIVAVVVVAYVVWKRVGRGGRS